MGMFSWDCDACGFSLRDCRNCSEDNWMDRAVCLSENGSRIVGQYDSYGKLGACDLSNMPGNFAIYHHDCWLLAGKPEYENRPARPSRDQGFCHAMHGSPLPRPTNAAWFQTAKTWRALERIFMRYAAWLADTEEERESRHWHSLSPAQQQELRALCEEGQDSRRRAYEDALDAYYANEPQPEADPKAIVFNGIPFDYERLRDRLVGGSS